MIVKSKLKCNTVFLLFKLFTKVFHSLKSFSNERLQGEISNCIVKPENSHIFSFIYFFGCTPEEMILCISCKCHSKQLCYLQKTIPASFKHVCIHFSQTNTSFIYLLTKKKKSSWNSTPRGQKKLS